jgi:putative redox protein
MPVHSETETPSQFRQVVRVDAHTLHADVLPALGGEDSAPGPHEYFDVSLATCKALTAAWYAKRAKIALERVEVDVTRDASKERQGTYVLHVKLAFFGPISDEDRSKLYDAVGRCPIHKLMTSATIDIQTEPLS